MADELYESGYLVVEDRGGHAHYVALPAKGELSKYRLQDRVRVRASSVRIASDRNDGPPLKVHRVAVDLLPERAIGMSRGVPGPVDGP